MVKTAVILAGGKSSRYGKPKGLEEVSGVPLIRKLADQIRNAGIEEIYISTDDTKSYEFTGIPIIHDRFKESGPLSGIYSALVETGADSILFLPCDMPGVTSSELARLISEAGEVQSMVVYVRTERKEHPLVAVIDRSILPLLEDTLQNGRHAVRRFFHDIDHHTVDFESETPFLNMNAPDDLRQWEKIHEGK